MIDPYIENQITKAVELLLLAEKSNRPVSASHALANLKYYTMLNPMAAARIQQAILKDADLAQKRIRFYLDWLGIEAVYLTN